MRKICDPRLRLIPKLLFGNPRQETLFHNFGTRSKKEFGNEKQVVWFDVNNSAAGIQYW